ncbi:MAG: UDP-N-acetylglucosamine 1-carboxyvinyltransferase [Selenomonadales bacterium]|nr:UDP-N-acetylglucosamine 1-carboxyvinyltransferase [Selenomonadales bacterium]
MVIHGGRRLEGEVSVSGAKNAALPILAAALLAEGETVLHRVPQLSDIRVMRDILAGLGVRSVREGDSLTIDAAAITSVTVSEQLMRRMRASVFLMGALLGRCGEVCVSYPGGCTIGPRPIDLHLKAFEKMGAQIEEEHGMLRLTASKLFGAEVQFDFPSVGATENAMLAAVLAEGVTILRNVAREPEVVDLQSFLVSMGAQIDGAGSDTITIRGIKKLSPAEYTIQPDRIEAGTLLLAGCISRGEIVLTDAVPNHLFAVIDKLREAGAKITCTDHEIWLRAERLKSVDIKTLPYPAFPTDLQAPMMAFLATAAGTGIVTETIFENRFKQVDELVRMGAHIRVEGRSAVVRGVPMLTGTKVEAYDLRAGASLVLAGLGAEGTTEITRVDYIDRGYEQIEEKLRQIKADIIRKKEIRSGG